MYASSRNKSNVPPLSTCHRSPSPSPSSSTSSSSSSTFASSSFSSRSSTFFTRATSPTRATNLYSHYYYDSTTTTTTTTPTPRSSSSVRFSTDRPISPGRSISFRRQNNNNNNNNTTTSTNNAVPFNKKRTCACSPTTHPGSYRCGLHRNLHNPHNHHRNQTTVSYHSSSRLNCRRSAMTNSLVRIGGVEGELVKRALTALIRPSSHQQRRRAAFEPRPSRLSKMANADDDS